MKPKILVVEDHSNDSILAELNAAMSSSEIKGRENPILVINNVSEEKIQEFRETWEEQLKGMKSIPILQLMDMMFTTTITRKEIIK